MQTTPPPAAELTTIPAEDARVPETALLQLKELDPSLCRLAELRLLCNLTNDEAAVVLGESPTDTKQNWDIALRHLVQSLRESHSATAG